jgi:hypothetical protein
VLLSGEIEKVGGVPFARQGIQKCLYQQALQIPGISNGVPAFVARCAKR